MKKNFSKDFSQQSSHLFTLVWSILWAILKLIKGHGTMTVNLEYWNLPWHNQEGWICIYNSYFLWNNFWIKIFEQSWQHPFFIFIRVPLHCLKRWQNREHFWVPDQALLQHHHVYLTKMHNLSGFQLYPY